MSRTGPSVPCAQLGEDLLHLSEDVSERWRLLDPHPVRTKAEAEPQGTVEGVLSAPRIVEEPVLLIIVVIVVFIVGHCIEEGVPGARMQVRPDSICHVNQLSTPSKCFRGKKLVQTQPETCNFS